MGEDGAGIEALVQEHEGNAGDIKALEDGGDDGRGAAEFGEEGGVDVDEAVGGEGQKGRGDQQAIGGDNDDVWREGGELLQGVGFAEGGGLEDVEAALEGELLDGGLGPGKAPAGGPVRRGIDGDDLVGRLYKDVQGRQSEGRGTHEDNSHGMII